jgi:hypothetical protein
MLLLMLVLPLVLYTCGVAAACRQDHDGNQGHPLHQL